MFESVLNFFGGGDKPKDAAPAPAPAATPAPATAPAPAADHTPAPGQDHTSPATANASAAAAAPGADQSKPKPVDQKAMDAAANTIFKKMDGWWVSGSDKSAILDQLRGKSPDEIAAIKRSYAEHFPGHDMDGDLGKHLDGKDLQEAKASETGDTVGAAVAAIKNAETGTWRGSVDSDRINTVLDSIKDPAQRAEVAKQVGGELSKMQSGNDAKLTQALLKGDTATASAVRIDSAQNSWTSVLAQGVNNGVFGGLLGKDFGTDKDAINKAIEDCKTPEDRAKLQQQYKLNTGTDLNKDLDKHLDGANRDVATKLLEGDTAAANAAKMKAATEHWFTDKDAIYKAMDGKSDAERKAMMADYKNMYGQDVDKMLDKELSGLDRDKAKELETNGKLSDAFALKYAQEGSFWSTDKQLIKDTLAGKSKAEIDALSADYKKKYGIDLQKELNESTSGRDGFEINELMKGEPQTLDEKMARSRERYDFERGSGSNIVSNAFNDAFSDKGKLLDQQQARAEELYKKIQSGQASPEEKALLDRVTGYQNLDTKNYQESKDAVTNGAVAVAAITAGAIATVATGGAAAPAEAAIIAALAAGTATVGTKMVLQGSGYSREELRNDLIMTGVNMATGGTMGALGAEGGALFNLAAKASDSPIVQQAIIQGVSGAVSTGVGNATQATLAGKDMKDVLKAGGMGVLTGGAGAATTGALGAGLKGADMFKGMDPVKAAMLRNAIAGAGGAAVSTGLDPDSYNGDSAALLSKWGLAVGGGAVGGAASGLVEGRTEVADAKKVADANEAKKQLGLEGQPVETKQQHEAFDQAKSDVLNPAEDKHIQKLEDLTKQGQDVKLPVEEKLPPSAVGGGGDAKPPTLEEPAAAAIKTAETEAKQAGPATKEEPEIKPVAPAKTDEATAQKTTAGQGDAAQGQATPSLEAQKGVSRDTRGWSEEFSKPGDAHLPVLEAGKQVLPKELSDLIHPPLNEHQQEVLRVMDEALARNAEAFKNNPSEAKLQDLIAEQERLNTSKSNIEASFEKQRQAQIKANMPQAMELMGQLREGLLGPLAPAQAAAEAVPMTDAAKTAVTGAGRTEADVRGDLADFARLAGDMPAVGLDRTKPRPELQGNGPGQPATLNVGDNPSSTNMLHEMGHTPEINDPAISDAAKAFRDARAKFAANGGEVQEQPLQQLKPKGGYEPGEVAVEGGFNDKYTGKVYPPSNPSTEIISMGMQQFTDPKAMMALFQGDPEHFTFMLGVLKTMRGDTLMPMQSPAPAAPSPTQTNE